MLPTRIENSKIEMYGVILLKVNLNHLNHVALQGSWYEGKVTLGQQYQRHQKICQEQS